MKPSLAMVLFAAACFASGCSSSPLSGSPEQSDVQVGAAGSNAVGAAGSNAVGVAGSSATGSAGSAPVAGPTSSVYALYPAGPYGTARGARIANLTFLGWKHPDSAAYDSTHFETVRLSDFYDPEGTSGVKLLAINASAVWCSVCRAEYQDMNSNDTYATYKAKGVEFLGTLFEDNSYYPAQPLDLKTWGSVSNHAVKFPLVLDPSFKMGAYFDSDATPLNMLVDVRTMTIVSVTMGYSTTYWDSVQMTLNRL